MVSTRGVKYKFTEGEKVLCYEPDPAKTKVLYNSKVLDIIITKDDSGKKLVEFLIHFQGWNSTWDRFVTEEYVLKDTEENRQLQKELAEKAQLTSVARGGNLYKRDRKKRRRKLSERISETLDSKRGRASPLTEPEPDPDLDASSLSDPSSGLEDEPEPIPIELSDTIKKYLEEDYKLITQDNKLLKLPCSPNVVTILENFVKHWALKQLCPTNEKPHRNNSTPGATTNLDNIYRKLNLCKEVADGLRIYFDFTLGPLLLYRHEREQFKSVTSLQVNTHFNSTLERKVRKARANNLEPEIAAEKKLGRFTPVFRNIIKSENDDVKQEIMDGDLHEEKYVPDNETDRERKKSLRSHRISLGYEHTNGVSSRPSSLIHNLRVSTPSSIASTSSVHSTLNSHRHMTLINHIQAWKLVPQSVYTQEPATPSLIYGAVHLARLFVKLPELLQPTNMPEEKLEVVLEYFGHFLKYLEDHKDWFDEDHYKDNPMPLPDVDH